MKNKQIKSITNKSKVNNSKLKKDIIILLRNKLSYTTNISLLKYFSNHKNKYYRELVAQNSQITPSILNKLANDKDPDVRYWVAYNIKITPFACNLLAQDKCFEIKLALADNINISLRAMKLLSIETNAIKTKLATNPSCPASILKKMFDASGDDLELIECIYFNRNCPEKVKTKLAEVINFNHSLFNPSCEAKSIADKIEQDSTFDGNIDRYIKSCDPPPPAFRL